MQLFEIVGKLSVQGAEKVSNTLGKISGVASKVGKGILVATGAVATGAVALVKSVSSSYGELQQSIGGVETLFKDSADTVIENANNAFKTAGISANDYMQQVTSFSASLLQAVGGDTKKACDTADMAIIDMADNANKMGTSIENIQNAYQGFAKQNYTMLDNLKLGYGGTKGEMERLLADAEKISGVKYDISNLNDVYNAIHVIQGELGITGTTAKEAGETISGSFGSMGAAWRNFMAGLGDPNADMKLLVENLAGTLQGAVKNVTPIIDNMVAVLPTVMDALIDTISSMLPTLIQTFTELITKVIDAIVTLLPEFIPLAVDCIMTVVQALLDNLPLLIDAGIQLIITLATGITEAIPTLIPIIIEVIIYLVDTLIDNLPLIIKAGIQLLIGVINGLAQAIPKLIGYVPTIIKTIVAVLIENLPMIVEGAIQIIVALTFGLIDALPKLIAMVPQIIFTIVETLLSKLGDILFAGVKILTSLIEGIWSVRGKLIEKAKELILSFINIITTLPSKMWSIGKDIVKGLWNGISNSLTWIKEKIKSWVGNVFSFIKKLFGINSPSTLFRDEIGVFLAQGIGEGITNDDSAEKSMKDKMKSIMDVADSSLNNVTFGANVNNLIAESPMQKYQLDFNAQIGSLNDGFERLISLIGNYLPEISENSKKELSVSGDKLVLGISRKMDSRLGELAVMKGRGNV